MAPHYQSATLIASPSYPNAIAWSNDNLVAVASGHIVTILNPASLEGPREIVLLGASEPFPIGVVKREDLFQPCLVPTFLVRDTEPCARSISWSQPGFAPNSGCLLAVCTADGHVNLYRSPIWEFCDEWVKVTDVSKLLFDYYRSINFGEDDSPDSVPQEKANSKNAQEIGCTGQLQEPTCSDLGRRKRKPARFETYVYDEDESHLDASKDADFFLNPCSKPKKISMKKIVKPGHEIVVNGLGGSQDIKAAFPCNVENICLPIITAKQYARRNAILSSLVVAWSPVVPSGDATSCLLSNWCILAVGSKSGDVSFWKICKPEYYTIDVCMVMRDPILVGVLKAHNSWVSAISWEVSYAEFSKSSLLLATGCSDGSVKIWSGNTEGSNQCTMPFSLLTEVTTDSSAPVSSISLSVPAQPQHGVNFNLAIGRVSGSLETWTWDPCRNQIENTSACHAHDLVVTGLSWSWDGQCLYSCSQDNSAHCWIFREKQLEEIPVHTNFQELNVSTDLSEVSNQCFGLAIAPGQLMIAVVHSLDPNLLDQMYQARTHKAVVEFIWIGGQFLGLPLVNGIPICAQQSATNFLWWGSNIFWSLKKYENGETELALWDTIAALQVLKKSTPTFLEALMHKWVLGLFSDDGQCGSISMLYHSRKDMMSKASLRKLHLLNIINRKVMLSNHAQYSPGGENGNKAETDFWNNLLVSSETELRARLVAFTFAAVLDRIAYLLKGASNEDRWFPVGIAQMDSWASMNSGEAHNKLNYLRSRIKDFVSRIDSVCEYSIEETCPYCSATVHFESPDVALCGGGDLATAPAERHKLLRCTTSMRLCSILDPTWYCVCCGGTVDKLVPETFFASTTASPLDANYDEKWLCLSAATVPLCPLCGILLQRLMPEFLLSVSPV
ncbi:hypothetical protein QYE76_054781 [Lolium multiflorum]|uniref:Transcription factor IIIC 90kDa subunit N-terminal domain-containing protein n=1 Tax=Lolium multiflorum TaxID=4521 RepID=A0AAD8WL69_LOLMU|nr:hypothetical protein QYE76_054781 [Lolium multiflorum]